MLQQPEVISLLNTKIDGYMDMSIRNIIAKHEKDKAAKISKYWVLNLILSLLNIIYLKLLKLKLEKI